MKESALDTAAQLVRHTAAKVPGILGAARGAGASTSEAVQTLALSTLVLLETARRFRGSPQRANAIRHFAWQALVSARHGTAVAERVAAANEVGSADTRDSAIDEQNNLAGRAWARAHYDDLASASLRQAVRLAFDEAIRQWQAGDLAGTRRHGR